MEKIEIIGFILGVYAFILTIVIGLIKKEYHKSIYYLLGIISILTIIVYFFNLTQILEFYKNHAQIIANLFLIISIILIFVLFKYYYKIRSASFRTAIPIVTNEQATLVGIKKIYEHSKDTLNDTIEQARFRYQFLGISAQFVETANNFRSIMENKKGCKFQFLLLNPSLENEGTSLHAKREKRDDLSHLITASVKLLDSLRKYQDVDVEWRFYNELPHFRLVILNNEICYVGYYGCTNHKGVAFQGVDLPQIVFKKTDKGIFFPFCLLWEKMWNDAIIPKYDEL